MCQVCLPRYAASAKKKQKAGSRHSIPESGTHSHGGADAFVRPPKIQLTKTNPGRMRPGLRVRNMGSHEPE